MNTTISKQIFSKNLRYYIDMSGKSRPEICEDLKVNYSTFVDWCNGRIYPRMDKVERLAKYFNIKKSDLIEERNPEADANVEKILQSVKDRPEMKLLFSVADTATAEDVLDAVRLLDELKTNR